MTHTVELPNVRKIYVETLYSMARLTKRKTVSKHALYAIYDNIVDDIETQANHEFIDQFSEISLDDFIEQNADKLKKIAHEHNVAMEIDEFDPLACYYEVLEYMCFNAIPLNNMLYVGGCLDSYNTPFVILKQQPICEAA